MSSDLTIPPTLPNPDEVRGRIHAAFRELATQRAMLVEVFPLVDGAIDALSYISTKRMNDAGLTQEARDLQRARVVLGKVLNLLDPHR